MSSLKETLQKARDLVYELKCDSEYNWPNKVRYSIQVWNLDKMISITEKVKKLCDRIQHNKDTQNER